MTKLDELNELNDTEGSKYIAEFQEGLAKIIEIEPVLAEIVESHEFPAFLKPNDLEPKKSTFEHLVRSVISQQISGTAAASILSRFMNLGTEDQTFPSPEQVSGFEIEQLRAIGFSQRKAEYTIGIAKLYASKELSDELFATLSNEKVFETITSVRGLGPWTAEMFLIFYLHRMDVFSPSDLGVQRGMKKYLEMLNCKIEIDAKRPKKSAPKMIEIASKFQPYRTAFQMVLWKLSDIQMDTVEARNTGFKRKKPESESQSESKPQPEMELEKEKNGVKTSKKRK